MSKNALRKVIFALPAALLALVIYYVDTIVFAAPIIAVSLWLGPLSAFAIFTPLYFLFDYLLGRLALGLVSGTLKAEKLRRRNRLGRILAYPVRWVQAWFQSLEDSLLGRKIRQRLSSSRGGRITRYASFVVASYFGTAFITIPMVYLLGQRRHLRLLTAFSAAVYAVTFVGQYALGTFITVELVKAVAELF